MSKANVKATINANIKTNNNQEITGPVLNGVLNQMVDDYGTQAEVSQLSQDVTENTNNIGNLQAEIDAIQPIIIEGDVTNAPDEEDITTDASDLLKFKDRAPGVDYMGYVILRKDKTFAEQVVNPNTIYEVRYDFDLNAGEVQLPVGCVFRFVGGSLANGTLSANPFRVIADNDASILKAISFNSSYISNETIYVDWFDFVTDGTTDNHDSFKRLEATINARRGGHIIFGHKKTYAAKTILQHMTNVYLPDSACVMRLKRCKALDIDLNGSTLQLLPSNTAMSVILEIDAPDIDSLAKVHNGNIIGDRVGHNYTPYINYAGNESDDFEWNYGIQQKGGYLELYDLNVSYCVGDGIMVGSSNIAASTPYHGRYYIHDCEVSYCGRNGISSHSAKGINTIARTYIHDHCMDGLYSHNPKAGIDFEFEDGIGNKPYIILDGLVLNNCYKGITTAVDTSVEGFILRDSKFYNANLTISNVSPYSTGAPLIMFNCYVELTDAFTGEMTEYLRGFTIEDCTFKGMRGIVLAPEFWKNCQVSTTADSTKLASGDSAFPLGAGVIFPVTENCTFEINAGYFQVYGQSHIRDTFFHFASTAGSVRFASVTFAECRFKTEAVLYRTNTNIGTGDINYNNCIIEWVGDTQNNIAGYSSVQNNIFNGCTFSNTYLSSYQGTITAKNCTFTRGWITKTAKTGVEKDIYTNCVFTNAGGFGTGEVLFAGCNMYSDRVIDKQNVLGIGNYSSSYQKYRFENCFVYARNFTNPTRDVYNSYYTCVLDIADAKLSHAKLYNCIVRSTVANSAEVFEESIYLLNGVRSGYEYPKFRLCADEAEYAAIATKDPDTLYLIPE